jgi:Cof subfamily protein (haloacid dehalogenase superfamily)
VRRICESGVRISLCTGRASWGCQKILEKLKIGGFHIFFDGALVSGETLSEEIYVRPLDPKLLRPVRDLAKEHGLTLELFSQSQFYVDERSRLADVHSRLMSFDPVVTDLDRVCQQERILLGCLATPISEEKRVMALFANLGKSLRFVSTYHPAHPEIRFINITMAGISKGTALAALIAHLGLKADEVAAIGDGHNDLSLFSNAGLRIAMGNAPPELKKAADYVTADVEHDGVAQAIDLYFSGQV